jgi:acyl dehydratase
VKFEDFKPGTVILAEPKALTREDIIDFARRWDPQWFHTDPERARTGRFGALVASGWQTCAMAMRSAVDLALADSESFASPGVNYIRWPRPVMADEPLRFRAEVLAARRSASQPDLGIIQWRWEMLHADGSQALELEVTSMFDLTAGTETPVSSTGAGLKLHRAAGP